MNRSHLIAAALLAGCSIPDVTFTKALPPDGPSGSDSGTGGVNRTISARWTLEHFATGALINCPDASVARVLAQPWSPVTQQATGATLFRDFACIAGTGVVMIPSDIYRMGVQIRSAAGEPLANSAVELADATQTDGALHVTLFDDAGYLTFSWDIINKATQARVSCAAAGITASDAIEIVETSIPSSGKPTADDFLCDDHNGTTAALLPGHYALSISAVKNSAAVGDVVTFADVQVMASNVTDLGDVKINVP